MTVDKRSAADIAVEAAGVIVSAVLAYMAARQLGLVGTSHLHHDVVRNSGPGYCFTCNKPLT
jgi:hypothetical protein